MDTNYKTASLKSANFLSQLGSENVRCFNLKLACQLLGEHPETVRRFLNYMVDRKLLMRVKEGLFFVIPYDQDPDTFMPDWHLLGSYLTGKTPYYIGYYAAMQLHSLITQPALKEQIVVSKQFKPAEIDVKGITFQFIYHNEKHFFGMEDKWINSFDKVKCSDLEKTLVDALFKPEYAGGITEIAKSIHKSKSKINYDKLLRYILKFDSIAVAKRLGYLLELLEISNPVIESLRDIKTKSYFPMEPQGTKEGRRLLRWNVQENIDRDSILAPLYT